ncbi:MAG: sigma 54-interacting transcriptional regulator [Desulfomonile tiedjei]|nr:sigma 54-interacting transcriptional regulator [Desulfomonile tiedjei]
MTEGVMVVENGGRILFVNRAMEQLTGYTREELTGQRCALLNFDCCARPPGQNRLGPCPLFQQGKFTNKYCSLRRKDGEHLTVLKNAQVLRDGEGETICAVEIQSDLTILQQREREISQLRSALKERHGFHGIIGTSPAMKNLFDLVKKAAASEAPVLIYGESGTGKELVAAAIHNLGTKSKGPFIRVNCAALSESLLESELFGHVKGAFTGATRTTKGRFEAAHMGDIFLDEIGDVPLSTQVKLLRVIQEKEFERVGDYRPVQIDVRVIAATHRDLRSMSEQGLFRDDLFYRLNVIPISIPPLRERPGDIPPLVEHFIAQTAARTGRPITSVDREAMEVLMHYTWPGNVREVINVIEYAFVVCRRNVITSSDLPDMTFSRWNGAPKSYTRPPQDDQEKRLVAALIDAHGNKAEAARRLGVSRQTVWTWMKKHGIDEAKLNL